MAKKPTQSRIKIAWDHVLEARRKYSDGHLLGVRGLYHLEVRALYKMGLLSYQDFCIVSDDMHKLRWRSRGIGRFYKRRLSKARRQAWKTGKDPVNIERECNWKGT